MYIQLIPALDSKSTVFLARLGELKSLRLKCLKALKFIRCNYDNKYLVSLPLFSNGIFKEESIAVFSVPNHPWDRIGHSHSTLRSWSNDFLLSVVHDQGAVQIVLLKYTINTEYFE